MEERQWRRWREGWTLLNWNVHEGDGHQRRRMSDIDSIQISTGAPNIKSK